MHTSRKNRAAAVGITVAMAAALMALAAPARATQALGVQTLIPGVTMSPTSVMADLNGTLYFAAADATSGTELWKTDGTTAGTVLVKDIRPGASSGSPANLTNINGTLFFGATDGVTGSELWKSDGTTAGTTFVAEVRPGTSGASPANFTGVNGVVLFTANNGTAGIELWKTDGTAAGTALVKDINAGSASSTPTNFKVFNNAAYFTATTAAEGTELWTSDGTTAGTVLVKDINPGTGSSTNTSNRPQLTPFAGKLFFKADGGTADSYQLWSTDGTTAGTAVVGPFNPGVGLQPDGIVVFNGALFFSALNSMFETELWTSDGTAAGTVQVVDILPSFSAGIHSITVVNSTLFFTANASTNVFGDSELYKSDGTAAGTVLVKDINPGPNGSNPNNYFNVNGTLFFRSVTAPVTGNELWTSDGTAAGTVLVADINPGTAGGSPQNMMVVNGIFFFVATGGTTGNQLRRTLVNDSPVAVDDSYSTAEDTPLAVTAPGVLANDTDADGHPLTAAVVTGPAHGSLTLNADGSFSYTPAANYSGPDSFTYSARDGIIGPNGPVASDTPATVNLTVTPTPDAPVAVDDAYSVNEDVSLSVPAAGVLANDNDPDGDPITAASVTSTTNGSLTLNADGSFTYTPNAGFHGSDTFTYEANDGTTDSNVATVTLTVTSVNDAPGAGDDTYGTTEDTPLTVAAPGVLVNDSDPDADPLAAGSATTPANGSVALGSDGSFTYTPNADFAGTDSFTYDASDGNGGSDTATVTIAVSAVNDAPSAGADAYGATEDTAVVVAAPGVLGNDTDPDADPLAAGSASTPVNGSVSLGADGSFTYTPDADFAGTDSFTYVVSDGNGGSDAGTATITVAAVNDAPVAGDDTASTAFNTPVTVAAPGVLGNDTDADGDPLAAGSASTPANGSVTLGADGSFTYTPASGFAGTDTFTYVASDANGGTDSATVAVTVAGPLVSVGSVSVAEGDTNNRKAVFTLSLSEPSASAVSVAYATADGTAGAASDYTAASGTAVFAPGSASTTVKVKVAGDLAIEANETFSVVLSDPVGATIANGTGTGAIVNDDAGTGKRLAIGDVSVHEGDDGTRVAVFTVSLSKASTTAVSVVYATVNGTAIKGSDYIKATGTLSFAPGITSMTIPVTVGADDVVEGNETFAVNLSGAYGGAVISDGSGLGTIVDDD